MEKTLWLKTLMFCVVFAAIPIPVSARDRSSDGKLQFETTSFDFGVVKQGSVLKHRFSFVNVGNGSLSVNGIHAACGCTVAQIDNQRVYAPGDSGYIDVELDTSKFSGQRIAKNVTIITSEKLLPTRNLSLLATVEGEVSAFPPVVNFGDVKTKSEPEARVKLIAAPGVKIKVKGLRYTESVLSVKIVEEAGETFLNVKLRPQVPAGYIKDTIFVSLSGVTLAELKVLVRANVIGSITVEKKYLDFGSILPGKEEKRDLEFQKSGPFQIVGTKMDLNVNGAKVGDVEPYLATVVDEASNKVSLTLKNQSQSSGSVHGKITLITDDPSQNQLKVDFYGYFGKMANDD